MTTTIAKSDVSAMSIPTQVSVPDSIDDATALLDDVGGLLSAGHWGTAAVVWAFTEPGTNQHKVPVKKFTGSLTITDFAALGIRGLSSRPSVIKYRQAWQHAIDEGLVNRAKHTMTQAEFIQMCREVAALHG